MTRAEFMEVVALQLAVQAQRSSSTWREDANDLLAAAAAAGCVVVPREPTREMVQAAYDRDMEPTECLYTSIYRAMLAASPLAQEPTP